MFKKWREARAERALHNDMDYKCIYWWGDRGGVGISVFDQRCSVCNPVVEASGRSREINLGILRVSR